MMRYWIRLCVVAMIAVGLTFWSTACRTSSHMTVRTYEETSPPEVSHEEEESTEWEMVSPGEMESAGEMESPGTMIVEP